jgi:hypothetical protein
VSARVYDLSQSRWTDEALSCLCGDPRCEQHPQEGLERALSWLSPAERSALGLPLEAS